MQGTSSAFQDLPDIIIELLVIFVATNSLSLFTFLLNHEES